MRRPPGKKDCKEDDEEVLEDPRAVGLVQAREDLLALAVILVLTASMIRKTCSVSAQVAVTPWRRKKSLTTSDLVTIL